MGIRFIQQGRQELFLSGPLFLELCDLIIKTYPTDFTPGTLDTPEMMRQAIIDYAVRVAKLDDRVNDDWLFENFAIIVNEKQVLPQRPHIDLLAPNLQFGLVLTNNAPGTTIYLPTGNVISNMEEFVDFLYKDTGLPNHTGFHKAYEKQQQLRQMLSDYGKCLCTVNRSYRVAVRTLDVPTGTVMASPGSTLHAGPGCEEFRAIMFFIGRPPLGVEYNDAVQYFDGGMLGTIVLLTWKYLTDRDKTVLLEKIAGIVGEFPNLSRHFEFDDTDPKYPTFVRFLKQLVNTTDRSSLISQFIRDVKNIDETENGSSLSDIESEVDNIKMDVSDSDSDFKPGD